MLLVKTIFRILQNVVPIIKQICSPFSYFFVFWHKLDNTFGVKFEVLNRPPVYLMTEFPLDLNLSSFVGIRSTCCPVKTMDFSDEKSITDENDEASFKAHSHGAVHSI